jgi:thiosulfate reductase cytochrome b subunit
MNHVNHERVYIFKGFERFWHWSQGGLILFLMLTGFEIHGTYTLFGFGKAVNLHTIAAWALVALWVFAIFWHLTTGEWRQYKPTLEKAGILFDYYTRGIFHHEPHPVRPTPIRKLNSLQRLSYLAILVLVSPLIWVTGWLQLFYGSWESWGLQKLDLGMVAFGHTFGAFLMLIFFIGHVYLATTGATLFSHVRAMITGWEEVD